MMICASLIEREICSTMFPFITRHGFPRPGTSRSAGKSLFRLNWWLAVGSRLMDTNKSSTNGNALFVVLWGVQLRSAA